MPAEYEEGWVAHTAAWHQLADIKQDRPRTWEAAKEGYLNWEPKAVPIYAAVPAVDPATIARGVENEYFEIPGWHQVVRDDNKEILTIQPDSLAIIGNNEFGNLVEYIMGVDIPGMPPLSFDTLSVLKGGRIVAVSLKLETPFQIPGDDSLTYGYMHFWTRHDGLGGMKCGPGMFRIVCSNTQSMAEAFMDAKHAAMTIRHTRNWATRVEEARRSMVASLGQMQAWEVMAKDMAKTPVREADLEWFLDKWLPFSSDMTDRQKDSIGSKRRAFLTAYDSATCESIRGTVYGLSQAAVEVCDHVFPAQSLESRVTRTIVSGNTYKAKALELARKMSS